MGDQGDKVDNSTLKILNQSACIASLPDFDGFFRMNFRLYQADAQVGKDRGCGCRMKIESSCKGRQGQGYGCKNYLVSNQNKMFNFARLASKNWKTTNLEILKFEARFAYAVKFWPDFCD